MITEREKEILKIIVEEYIKTARPISSSFVSSKIDCSSATVRNKMVELEEMGYLEKNHFASGRVPSEDGYRYYVENLMEPKEMTGEDILKLQTIFRNNSLDLSDTIKKSIEIVSEITNYTSIVLGSSAKDNKLKKVEIVPLEDSKVLTMVITDKGIVEHKILYLANAVSIDEVRKTVELINKMLIGTIISEVSERLEYDIKPIIGKYVVQHEVLYNAFYDAFSEFTNKASDVRFVGKNNFLKQPEFTNIDKVREILGKFEDVDSIREEKDSGINIYIGSDNDISDDVSVIKTKYNFNGEEGTIAIVGPKRMEYDRVISLLDYIKDNIGGNNEE